MTSRIFSSLLVREGGEWSAKNKSGCQCCLSNVERNARKVGDCSRDVW